MADYVKRILNKLDNEQESQSWCERKLLSVKENGKEYKVELDPRRQCAVLQVDGGLIKNGIKCDKLVIATSPDVIVYVELKGKDISHAIDQLKATITHQIFKPLPTKDDKVLARIVCSAGPASAARKKFEKAKIEFRSRYNCDLRSINSCQKEKI